MARPRDYLMGEIRETQKKLTAAKKRGNEGKVRYLRFRISELQKEMERA